MKIKCPACSKVLAIPESAAGKVVKCPCGKQLRAPAAKPAAPSAGAAPAGGAGQPTAAPARPAAQPAGGGFGGFDAAMFDELTDGDLKPMPGAGSKPVVAAAPAGNTAKLLNEHAATAGGTSSASFRVGPIASPWNRLAAAIIDGFVIALLAGPVIAIVFVVLGGSMLDLDAVRNATTEAEAQAAANKAAEGLIGIYFIALPLGYALPIILYAWMVTKSGQTPGKKLCKMRIVTSDTKELPGFQKGVFLRSWVINIAYMVPLVGALFALIDYLMVFSENRQTIHDRLAGTVVVDT